MEEAIKSFNDIIKVEFPSEFDIIHQVIEYNNQCIDEDELHIQSDFIIGSLTFKKLNRPLEAYSRLEKFIQSTNDNNLMIVLNDKARELLNEIDEIIQIPK